MILLVPTVSALNTQQKDRQSAKLITYNSVLQMSYDENAVNNAVFQPDGAPVSISLLVKFKVEIPEILLSNFILRILFLQTFIITSAKIKLSVVNAPDWATVSFSNPEVYADISPEFAVANTTMTIAVHSGAPSESYNLIIKAETDSLLHNHVPANDAEVNIVFQPNWTPFLEIFAPQSTVQTPPDQITVIPINVTNCGNAQTKVSAQINTSLEGWSTYIIPPQIILSTHETQQMTLLLIPPVDFEGIKNIEILFNSSSLSGENGSLVPFTIMAYYNIR